ncbi:MAG: type II toxin-antitoxin system PemK/MazF family toxin [Deltaproteobacteria bacterium]|nr:type II toxin-antitoxin system PemK/MazF family toxin [Deltaproteobacteria bacterium]
MSKKKPVYHPERGDICYLDMDPILGVEQDKRRPVLVLSDGEFNRKLGLAFFCPITSTPPRHGFHIKLTNHMMTKGVVIIEQLKSLDYVVRHASFVERASDEVTVAASAILLQIIK